MFITPPPPDSDGEIQVFFGENGSVSSIDLAEGENNHDSANSFNFESTRRPDSYVIESTSESDTGFTITMRKTDTNQHFSKKRRLAEAAALETSLDDSFMNDRPASLKKKRKTNKKKTTKKIVKRTTWQCHVCFSVVF